MPDKITKGHPKVMDVIIQEGICAEKDLIKVAGSLEKPSEHPLSGAIVEYAKAQGTDFLPVGDYKAIPGEGIQGCQPQCTRTGNNKNSDSC